MYIYICMIHMHFVLISPPTHPIYTFFCHVITYVCMCVYIYKVATAFYTFQEALFRHALSLVIP